MRTFRALTFIFCSLCLSLTSAARAAEFNVLPQQGDKPSIILVQGDLLEGDEKKFINSALSLSDTVVILESDGGNLVAGIEIGKAIKLKGFSTFVPNGSRCASACGLAWLGGRVRIMGRNALVGFHAAYSKDDGKVSSAANALIGAYLNQLGLPSSAVIYITSPQPDEMRYLTIADAQRVGIDVKEFDLKQPRGNATTPLSAPERKSLVNREKDTASFVRVYWQTLSNRLTNSSDLGRLFNPEVDYYGKPMDRSAVIEDKENFFKRWPNRDYQMESPPTSVSCDGDTCYVYGMVRWDLSSDTRGRRSTGSGRYSFAISWRTGSPQIFREVLDASDRKIETYRSSASTEQTPLAPAAPAPAPIQQSSGPELLGSYGAWNTYVKGAGRSQTCYALASPMRREPYSKLKDTTANIFITNRPGDRIKNEIAINLGYPTSDRSEGTASVDGKIFELITKGTNAWIRDQTMEDDFIRSLRSGSRLIVKAYSARGTPSYDTYNLNNVSGALNRSWEACN